MKLSKLVAPGVVGVTALAGVAGGTAINALSVSADTASTTSTSSTTDTSTDTAASTQQTTDRDESKGGHQANGITETLLTGDTATKATAAAEAAVSGGTVLRVETDAEGATYEAHVKKSDGTQVTVKMDENFKVTSIDDGPGTKSDSTSSSTNS